MKNAQGKKAPRNNRSKQSAKGKAPKKRSCPSCCLKCLPIVSGFILLILIAGTITLIRGVLEVPMIINGFAPNRPVQTTVATTLDSTTGTSPPGYTNSTYAMSNSNGGTAYDMTKSKSISETYNPGDKCYFVGELEVKDNISIELNSDPRSSDYITVAAAVESMITIIYNTSKFNKAYVTTKLIGISSAYSAIRFWMHFLCSVNDKEKEITKIFQANEDTIELPNNGQLMIHLNSTIIWCRKGMLKCSSGYCVNKYNGYCDDVNDCWDERDEENCITWCAEDAMVCPDGQCVNKRSGYCDGIRDCKDGSDEFNCDCESAPTSGCPSVVSLTGTRYTNHCQGSLLANRWVLTSGSCAEDSSLSHICAGFPSSEKYRISSRRTLDSRGDGIGLLYLSKSVPLTDFQPIPLPDPANQIETNQTSCRVTGLRDKKRQGDWRVIASDERAIRVYEDFSKLRTCQVQKGSPLLCLKGNDTWVLTAVRGSCSRNTDEYRRINHVLSSIKGYMFD